MNKKIILTILFLIILVQTVSAEGLSVQLKRTNPGIAKIKPAELIYDIVNTDMTHQIEGFIWCRSPDDIKVSSTQGFASGSGAQYISPKFYMDEGPSQRAVYLTIESDYEGDFSTGCTFKYAPYKEINGAVLYQKMNGVYTSEKSDDIFRELRLDKTVPFVSSEIEGDIYCSSAHCSKEDLTINKIPKSNALLWGFVGILAVLAVILLAIIKRK